MWRPSLTLPGLCCVPKSIPTTAILPELELEDSIDTLKELTEQCRVDAEQAQASVAEDAIAIKKKIMDESWNQ